MGSTSYSGMDKISSKSYESLYASRVASSPTNSKIFTHTSAIRAGYRPIEVHERIDPSKIKDSKIGKRESRDSDATHNSNAIAVLFDVTGSMFNIPVVLQTKLAKLMSTILARNVVSDPQILFGAIGDATCDKIPFQVGQFESDLAMDEDLDKFYLEGGGGGQNTESYELGLYFLARLTSIDCYEKRGKKGYAFIIGDERAYDKVKASEVKRVFGIDIGEDIPLQTIVDEVKEMYDVFFIVPTNASWGTKNKNFWVELFGQNVLEIENPDLICETIVTAIGMAEGVINSVYDVAYELELDVESANVVDRALSKYSGGKLSVATVSGDLGTDKDDELE